jgi:hypothetical protein
VGAAGRDNGEGMDRTEEVRAAERNDEGGTDEIPAPVRINANRAL